MTFKYIYKVCFTLILLVLVVSPAADASSTGKHLGLKTVVIDPGHGGKDPGALGKNKSQHEKHIVLAVSKMLGRMINEKYPDVKVIYTRTTDTFIGLHERAMVARRNNADLFISIHCNGSSNTEAKGSSVHILGQNSNNKKNSTDYFERNMTTAQRENSVIVLEDDYKTKYQSYDPDSPESYISHQLQWMAYYESSLLFASEVVNNLIVNPLTPRRLVVDQDIFQVLVEANMPAVLLELAFVTNPTEYKYLSSADGQKEMASRLFKAFVSYKTKFDASVNVSEKPVQVAKQSVPAEPVKVQEPVKVADPVKQTAYYSIQVMALGKKLSQNDSNFKGLTCDAVKSDDSSIYKYVYGKFASAKEAASKLTEVKKKFPEAFVVEVNGSIVKRVKL